MVVDDDGIQIEGTDLAKNEEVKEKEKKEVTEKQNELDNLIISITANISKNQTIPVNSLTIVGIAPGISKIMLGDKDAGFVQNEKIKYSEDPEIKKQLEEIKQQLNEANNGQKQSADGQTEQTVEPDEPVQDPGAREEEHEEDNLGDRVDEPDEKDKDQNEKLKTLAEKSGIEIRSDREIDEMKTFFGAIKKEHPELGDFNRAFIIPDEKDGNNYKLVVKGSNGKFKEVPLEMTEGKNPMQEDVMTMDNDGNKATQKKPIQMLKINNRNMIMIFNGGRTTTSIHIGTRTDGDNYHSAPISNAKSQNNLEDPSEEAKKHVSSARGNQVQGDNSERAYTTIQNFKTQGVPEEIDPSKDQNGIEATELDNFPKGVTTALEENLRVMFNKKGINLGKDTIRIMAKGIVEDKKGFEQAVIDGMKEEEKQKRIPSGSAEKKGKSMCEAIEKDENVLDFESQEQEQDPRLQGDPRPR